MAELSGDIQHVHDPALLLHGGKWHLFATGNGIPYRVSDDGVRWRYVREVFSDVPAWGKEAVPGVRNPWAPDISWREGRVWLYYSLSTFGSQRSAIGLASAETPEATAWRDEGPVLASRPGDPYNAIDPNAFQEKSGRLWLTFGSFWSGIHLVELDPKNGKPLPGAAPRCIAARPKGSAIEAPFLWERDGWVYLFAGVDFCCRGARSTYKTIVGRSRHPDERFVDRDGVPLTEGGGSALTRSGPRWRGPGHPALVRAGRTDWLAVHAYDAHNGGVPTLRLLPIRWRRGWPEAAALEPAPTAAGIPGLWEHMVDGGAANQLSLRPDGAIEGGRRGDTAPRWEREGDGFTLIWPAADAPGGAWKDRCRLSADRLGYVGTNQRGQAIAGWRVGDA